VLTTVKCALVRLRAPGARHSARLLSNRPIVGGFAIVSPQPKFLEKLRDHLASQVEYFTRLAPHVPCHMAANATGLITIIMEEDRYENFGSPRKCSPY
jgi:hypothetical protein